MGLHSSAQINLPNPLINMASFLDDYYSQYNENISRKPDGSGYSFRPNWLSRSVSQWDLQDAGGHGGHRAGGMESSPRSQHSSSSWDLNRPQTSSSGVSSFSSPPPYHDLATGEYRYLHRMRWKKEKEEWNLANGINFSYTSPYMADNCSIVKA